MQKQPEPMDYPAIVVNAYNRPAPLKRLLDSMQRAVYPTGAKIPLHISIDRGESGCSQAVQEIAGSFPWEFGEKRVVCQEQRLGLVGHFNACGNLTHAYGSIVYLEDDLLVSPMYYTYSSQALRFYERDERIAGISLYALWFNGYTHQPFVPLTDEADVFFLQVPYSQGQAFSRFHWDRFTAWQGAFDSQVRPGDAIHEAFLHFPPNEWFPVRMKYLIDTQRYYVFPRESLATGWGDIGSHFSRATSFFQVPLQRFKTEYRLKEWEQSAVVYDSFFEILPERLDRLTDRFHGYAYEVDLNGTKSRAYLERSAAAPYVLSTRRSFSPFFSFGQVMWPLEANVIDNTPGNRIAFGKKEDLDWSWLAGIALQKQNHDYFTRGWRLGKRQRLLFWLVERLEKLRA